MQTLTHSTDRGGHGDGVWTKPTRILLLVAIPALISGPAPLLGQDTTYALPDSFRHLGLPDDPLELARQVEAAGKRGEWRSSIELFQVGCVTDGGWAGAAFNGLEQLAETNDKVRSRFSSTIATHWNLDVRRARTECAADHPRIERLLTRYLREELQAGRLGSQEDYALSGIGFQILQDVVVSSDPETYALVQEVLHDGTVLDHYRERARSTLVEIRQRLYGETEAVADSTVLADAEEARPPEDRSLWGYPSLPADPAEFVWEFVEGIRQDGPGPSSGNIFLPGCVADGGWTADAFNGLVRAAEADSAVRGAFVYGFRSPLIRRDCAADIPRIEALLTRYLREAYEAGPITDGGGLGGVGEIAWQLASESDDPEVHALVREVLHDTTVHADVRESAWRGLIVMRRRIHGETWAVADSTVRSGADKAVFSGRYVVPNARKRYRIPDDPMEFVREVRGSPPILGGPQSVPAGTVPRDPADLFKVCPADGEWAAATFEALEQAAETDSVVRRRIADRIGLYWRYEVEQNTDRCSSVGHQRIERLLARYLREDLEAARLVSRGTAGQRVLGSLEAASDPETYELVEEVLHDTTVNEGIRFEAFSALPRIHQRLYGVTDEIADSAVRANACKADGLPFGYCVVPTSTLLGQDTTTYTIPDSLRYLQLSADPLEFVREVQTESPNRGWWRHLFKVGCVANGGWPEAVFNALERFSEINFEVRGRFAEEVASHWAVNVRYGYDRCAVDHPRIEALLVRYVREDHEAGWLGGSYLGPQIAWNALRRLGVSDNPETYALVRDILYDETVAQWFRESAWSSLAAMRQRMYGETEAGARNAVQAEAEKAGIDINCVPLLSHCVRMAR